MNGFTAGSAATPLTNTPAVGVRGYRPELDAVRLLAFLLVFFHHQILLGFTAGKLAGANSAGVLRATYAAGNACGMGLCLFFALSAYLITELLLREREQNAAISVRKFYIRRILRIWPLYFFGIAIGVAISLLSHQYQVVTGFVWYLLFVGNIYCGAHAWSGNPMTPLWSISIEEQFYLLWPWAMRWFSRRGLALCALGFILAANATLWVFGARHADTDTTVWTNTLTQFEMFAVGILLALADTYARRIARWVGFVLLPAGPALWFVACFRFHAKQSAAVGTATSGLELMVGYSLIALGCAAVLQGFCTVGSSWVPRWVAYLGKISYGLYVFHLFAIEFTEACFSHVHGFVLIAGLPVVALLLTIAVAALSYKYLESPFLRLKKRFEIVHTRPI